MHGGFRPLRRAGCAAPARRGRARGGGTPCSPSSCQSPPLPSGRAARVKPGNVKRFPPVYRTKQSLPFRTPRGERLHRPNKFFYPELLCEPASRNTPVFFAAVPVSGALRQQSVRRPSNQRGDSQEGNFPSCAPAARAVPFPPPAGREIPPADGKPSYMRNYTLSVRKNHLHRKIHRVNEKKDHFPMENGLFVSFIKRKRITLRYRAAEQCDGHA